MRKLPIAAFGLALAAVAAGPAEAQLPPGLPTQSTIITSVNANIVGPGTTTWCDNEDTMVLEGPIFVTNGATLRILAPCIVRGQPRTAPPQTGVTAGTPGALIITQDGRLVAEGQPTAPIIFTTATTDTNNDEIPDPVDPNNPTGFRATWQPGEAFYDNNPYYQPTAPLSKSGRGTDQLWGSLVLLGRAPTNLADKCLGDPQDPNSPPLGWGMCTVEGLTVPGFPAADCAYGGVLPHDSSGILRYVSLRHGGDLFGGANELNGLSLAGVGDGTIVENVEVYVNFDDGFEWFGGTVNGKNLVVSFVGDDLYDVDEGYTGTNQNLFGVMPFFNEGVDTDPNAPGNDPFGDLSGDKAGEFDGENYRPDQASQNDNLTTRIRADLNTVNPNPWPMSNPDFFNMTLIGSTVDASPEFPLPAAQVPSTNRGIQFRNGFAGNVHNSIIVNTGAETGVEVDTGLATSPAGFAAIDNANNGLINVVCTTMDDGAAPAAQENTVINNGNAMCVLLGGTAPGCNNAVNPAGPADFLVNEDTTFDPTGNAGGKLVAALKTVPINPRPALAGFPPPPIGSCPVPTGTGLEAVTRRGAFPTSGSLWACPWSVLCISGLMQ